MNNTYSNDSISLLTTCVQTNISVDIQLHGMAVDDENNDRCTTEHVD